MKLTEFFRLRMPDGTDPVNIEDFNDNFEVIDKELKKRISSGESASDVTVEFEAAESRQPLKSGEKLSVLMGKAHRFFTDLKTVAFSGKYGDLSERPTLGGAAGYKVADNDTTNNSEFLATARVAYEHGLEIDALSRDLDVGSDSGMTIGSMVKAIYDKVINSAAISGHLRGGRSRGGSGTGEVTFNNIKKGSTITISSVVIPSGAGEAIKTTVDGNIVITGAGSYTLTKDGTVKITAHVYLGEEGTSGYAECDFKIV
jgi:hypothetical protein